MAKSNRGGRRNGATTPPNPPAPQNNNPTPGGGGGGLNISNLAGQYNQNAQKQYSGNNENNNPDYTGNNNAELLKLQQKLQNGDYDAIAKHLKNISQQTDLSQYPDEGRSFYDFPYQKFLLRNNLTDKPTFMDANQFNAYVQQTGQQVMYRGWSCKASADMLKANLPHTGNGVIGDGWYFSPSTGTAQTYGNYMTTMALSPSARVADISTIRTAISNLPTKLQRSLSKAGSEGSRSYGSNMGDAQMALAMGYNVIKSGSYYVALTRDALVVKKF